MPVYENAFVNWLLWLYLAPGAAALLALRWSKPEDPAASLLLRLPSIAAGLAAIVLVFVWINFAILNAFDTSPSIELLRERMPARDLSLSLSWALYAFTLLILGVSRKATGLRWTSLVLFLGTIGKVFLFDLGDLTGLYRVASLLGLALTLLAVSLLYQRFVFRREPSAPPVAA